MLGLQVIERARASEQLVQHHAERVDVGGGAERAPLDLLGAGVGECHRAQYGGRRCRSRLAFEQARDAEVEQLGFAIAADHDVRRFQVAVDHQAPVSVLDRRTHLEEQRDTRAQRQLLLVAPAVDALAVDVLHRQERHAGCIGAGIDQMRDVRMLQRREDASLGDEMFQFAAFRQAGAAQHLQRDALADAGVVALGQPHLAHAAFAKAFDQAVLARRARLDACFREQAAGEIVDAGERPVGRVAGFHRRDQPVDFAAQFRVVAAGGGEQCLTIAVGGVQYGVRDRLGALVAFVCGFGHGLSWGSPG